MSTARRASSAQQLTRPADEWQALLVLFSARPLTDHHDRCAFDAIETGCIARGFLQQASVKPFDGSFQVSKAGGSLGKVPGFLDPVLMAFLFRYTAQGAGLRWWRARVRSLARSLGQGADLCLIGLHTHLRPPGAQRLKRLNLFRLRH